MDLGEMAAAVVVVVAEKDGELILWIVVALVGEIVLQQH